MNTKNVSIKTASTRISELVIIDHAIGSLGYAVIKNDCVTVEDGIVKGGN